MNLLIGIAKALAKIFRHRVALWKAGRKLGVSTHRILKHDNSKFHPIEFMEYVRRFELGQNNPESWAKAWEHHWRNNDHHIEYWQDKNLTFSWYNPVVIKNDNGIGGGSLKDNQEYKPVWMPDAAIKEMIADWMAASYAYSGQWPKAPNWKWGNENLVSELMKLEICSQPEICTRGFAVTLLDRQGMITREQMKEALTL